MKTYRFHFNTQYASDLRDAVNDRRKQSMISSSDYSIKEAIGLYDKDRQRRLEEQKIYEQQIANRLADEQIQLTYEQNDLLDEHNSISDRASKDARNAAIAEIVQRHNTNKMLKKAFRK